MSLPIYVKCENEDPEMIKDLIVTLLERGMQTYFGLIQRMQTDSNLLSRIKYLRVSDKIGLVRHFSLITPAQLRYKELSRANTMSINEFLFYLDSLFPKE